MKRLAVLWTAVMLVLALAGGAAAQVPAKKAKKAKKAVRTETAASSGDARVVNVKAQQAGNRVVFEYDLEGAEGAAEVVVSLTVQGRTYGTGELHLMGDVGRVAVGRGKRMTWNVLQDFPKGYGGTVDWEIKAASEGRPARAAATAAPVFTSRATGAQFVLIPAGSFLMGSPMDEPGHDSDESPQHRVTISRSFYMQTTEVTQGQWRAVMGNNPSYFQNCGDDCPVENVSWNDVQEFIGKLNRMEGTDKYRLPTEAEWEYAARAGTTTPFHTGNCLSTEQANYAGNDPLSGCPKGKYRETKVRVGSFAPNAWGLYDMHGNVWEWVQDWKGTYPSGHVTDPTGPESGSRRVFRGGSWYNGARYARAAFRGDNAPGVRDYGLGFRLLRTL